MLFKLFTVYDVVSEVYMQPFCAVTKGSAIRMFAAHVNDPSHPFGKDPKDYILFELGEYEDSNASFK